MITQRTKNLILIPVFWLMLLLTMFPFSRKQFSLALLFLLFLFCIVLYALYKYTSLTAVAILHSASYRAIGSEVFSIGQLLLSSWHFILFAGQA